MGAVSSRLDEGPALFLREQSRLSIASLAITHAKRKRTLLNVTSDAYPATRIAVSRGTGDDSVLDFVQDPEASSNPAFLLRLNNDDDLEFTFTLIFRQPDVTTSSREAVETTIHGLTFAFASTPRELDNLVTREFHADPNFHKNSNVQLLGDYGTDGSPSVSLEWSWKWRPPKPVEDRGGGWRTTCSFLEYDQRAHRLNSLATFSFWVQNTSRNNTSPPMPGATFEMARPRKTRLASTQSLESGLSAPDERDERSDTYPEPASPGEAPAENGLGMVPPPSGNVKVDVSCQRPGEDMSAVEDGPLFRATMKSMEQKTGNMRIKMKKVLKKAEAAQQAQVECNAAAAAFTDALREASISNANAIQPALEHYFERIAKEILHYERQNTTHLQKLIIDPLTKLYTYDIKQAEAKKKEFEDESRDYYAYVGRYLGQRQDSLKEKKRVESDSKYQSKRRNFELKRFDYSSFMQDLHGGRKEQEVLSHLTRYADAQARSYMSAAKKVEKMVPQLEALTYEVKEADKEFQFHRTEREEKRRTLEKSTKPYVEPESTSASLAVPSPHPTANGGYLSDSELGRGTSSGSSLQTAGSNGTSALLPYPGSAPSTLNALSSSPGTQPLAGVPSRGRGSDKFKGFRDLEERDHSSHATSEKTLNQQRKEGLLWALSRPGSHVDPKGLNKQAWHKFWIVLDQGTLSEYSNWKQKLDLHMDPIDLRMASVREARNAERRFCFEVITPHYKRVYQATSEEDMTSWISSINNALQSAVEGRGTSRNVTPSMTSDVTSNRPDIKSALTGKISAYVGLPSHTQSTHGHHAQGPTSHPMGNNIHRRTTVAGRPTYLRSNSSSFDENPSRLLQIVRDADQGNCWCADCGSGIKTEWVSINLGIILCIECSGIHRSLGTHITKIRSLTLDTTSFSTDIVELLLQVGNRVSNMIWEAKLDATSPTPKPTPTATREQRLRFITAKYVDRAYVAPISPTLSRYSTPEETLLASIKQNDLQGVLYGLALGASPNATDRSRATHAVFLALAATDPASSQAPGTSPTSPKNSTTPFPIPELLVQNGAVIPTTLPAFPLSRNATVYVEQKSGREVGGAAKPGAMQTQPSAGGPTDSLGSLPGFGSPAAERDRAKEAESRLQKRVSAGGRLARSSHGDG
ncbi:MAG: hypothetical protein M1838_004461 [Thelocarpon superellum]|nr:MAG: hypothetical protein M1838_004461 [Thelocarpon superellum]